MSFIWLDIGIVHVNHCNLLNFLSHAIKSRDFVKVSPSHSLNRLFSVVNGNFSMQFISVLLIKMKQQCTRKQIQSQRSSCYCAYRISADGWLFVRSSSLAIASDNVHAMNFTQWNAIFLLRKNQQLRSGKVKSINMISSVGCFISSRWRSRLHSLYWS